MKGLLTEQRQKVKAAKQREVALGKCQDWLKALPL